MKPILHALAAAVMAASAAPALAANTPDTTVTLVDGREVPAVANEYLVGREAAVARLPRTAHVRDLGGGWQLVVNTEPGDPDLISRRMARDAGGRVVPNILLQPADFSDEPLFVEQWALENTGQTGGVPDADIDALPAWEIATGTSSVVVAVLDSGIDLDHPELAPNLWVNLGEVAGNGVDDDGNGYIDDVNGWDFVGNDADVTDTTGHGTQVTGVLAAAANGSDIVGIAPGVRIMPLRVCGAGCPLGDIIAGIAYANDMGAAIANMSFTGVGPFFAPIGDLLAGEAQGLLAVAAAGNEGVDIDLQPRYPASFDLPNIISVAATDDADAPASFTNFGEGSVDLGAPGAEVLTTTNGGGTATANGTSYSAPYVAGVAALIASERPNLAPEELADYVLAGVDPVPGLTGITHSGGRLNARNALAAATGPIARIVVSPSEPAIPVTVTFSATTSNDQAGSIVGYEWVFSDGSTATTETVSRTFDAAVAVTATLTVTDDDGLTGRAIQTVALRDEGAAVVTVSPAVATAPATVEVSAVLPGSAATAASWDFGDGVNAGGITAGHVFTQPGVYTVSVEVTNASGGIGTGEAMVYIGVPFVDTGDSVFTTDIAWLSATGITRGCNPPLNDRFCPLAQVTRGQFAAMIVRALGLPPGIDRFVDDEDSIFEADIDALAAAGITLGCNPPFNDRFCPDRMLTRAQLASLLVRALELPEAEHTFTDVAGSVHEPSIRALAAAGITRGCNPPVNDRFCPNDPLTRAQFAAFLRRAGV
jgi:subtilisin family serine protease